MGKYMIIWKWSKNNASNDSNGQKPRLRLTPAEYEEKKGNDCVLNVMRSISLDMSVSTRS